MLNLREVEDAIRDLESGSATYNNCMKLASLYIVRDELKHKEGSPYSMYGYGYSPISYERRERDNNRPRPSYYNDDDLMIKKDHMRDMM